MTDCQFDTTHSSVCWGWGPRHYECALREIERLRAEVERLSIYYKTGISCFANPCERHSGERTPPFDVFFEEYGGKCLMCLVDNNKALQAENERLTEALRLIESAKERGFGIDYARGVAQSVLLYDREKGHEQ